MSGPFTEGIEGFVWKIAIFTMLVEGTVVGGIIYLIYHFVRKFW